MLSICHRTVYDSRLRVLQLLARQRHRAIYVVYFDCLLLFCQPRVEVTSCFVYEVMGLTFYDRINTQLIYMFELAQVVARRITNKPERNFLGSNLTGCSFFFIFFLFFGGGGGSDFIIFFMFFFSFYLFCHYNFSFHPFNMYKAHI